MDFIIICILSGYILIGGIQGQSVNQTLAPQTILEGESLLLECKYTISGTPYLFWYVWYPGQAPAMLLSDLTQKSHKGFTGTHKKEKSSYNMIKDEVKVTDSGVYFCAVSLQFGGANKLIFGSGTKLTIIPKTERTDTSVYKLKSRKEDEGLPNSVCLVTDFPSPKKNLKVDGIESSLNVTAVLDKSTNDVWRYSTVVWDNNDDVNCRVQYGDGPEKSPNSGPENAEEACSSLSIDASFRTNPSMNTSSLTVLGLRIVTAKAIIFNLIITLRLWSS